MAPRRAQRGKTGVRHPLLWFGALLGLGWALPAAAQTPFSPASTPTDSLEVSFSVQARTRFQQASVEVTRESWTLLSGAIGRGTQRLLLDGATTGRVAQARESLNQVVDWMIEASVPGDGGGRVAGEASFRFAIRRCPPPKYPFCP